MSINVYITRRPITYEPEGDVILESDWVEYVETAADFRLPTAEELADSFKLKVAVHESIWNGHSQYPAVWFVWVDGQVEVRNPDEQMIARMQAAAKALGARVISESGEKFDNQGRHAGFEPWAD